MNTLKTGVYEQRVATPVGPDHLTAGARAVPEPPEPWRTYCEDRQAVALAAVGDKAWVVWFHNELLLVGRDGHAERLLQGFPAPLAEPRCGAWGEDGTLWLGGRQGLACLRHGKWEFYGGPRWLPSDEVLAVTPTGDGEALVTTAGGAVAIRHTGMSLEQKAALFEQQVRARHVREGFVTGCHLAEPGDLGCFTHEASDNDGLWTALYVAAQSFRYAVTGSEEARNWAWQSARALLDLERRTPIPGFPARAIVRLGENVIKSHGEWHLTSTYIAPGTSEPGPSPDGAWEWKGDTSSDELDGHYFGLSIFYDLVADEAQKQEIREVIARITDHLIDHDFLLVDLDGLPTRWGVFAPRFLNGSWEAERGLNSLSILSHLATAHHICGDSRYLEAAAGLVRDYHYALNALNQKIMPPGDVNHSDDELAFVCYYPLLTYERDPDLRRLYLLSLERSWRIERPERNSWWNFIYGALTGNPCDAEAAVQTLAEIPLDLVNWPVRNSHRSDVVCAPRLGRFGEVEGLEPFPACERPVGKWNSNPFRLDGGGDGRHEEDATHYLLPYWLGRHHGLIE